MRVFVTGASGFIGSAVVRELLGGGHHVVGLARSDESAARLAAVGVEVLRGDIENLDSLRAGAANADGVIHLAYIHDFSEYARAGQTDRRAIETIGETLAGSDRPLVVTAGMIAIVQGRALTEHDAARPGFPRASEEAALPLAARGVRVSVLRLPPSVHGEGDHGFVPRLIEIARAKGVSAYPGDGRNRWSAVHRVDAARLFRLAVERASAGAVLHGVGDDGVPVEDIAGVIGRHLNLPVTSISYQEAADHFGWLGPIFALDLPASSTLTRQQMGWQPTGPGLLPDLDEGHYFADLPVRSS